MTGLQRFLVLIVAVVVLINTSGNNSMLDRLRAWFWEIVGIGLVIAAILWP